MDFMSPRRQGFTKAMARKNWPSITHCGQVAWDDVKEPHKSNFARAIMKHFFAICPRVAMPTKNQSIDRLEHAVDVDR
jgi:hypothetical protein